MKHRYYRGGMRKHKIGVRERARLQAELVQINARLDELHVKDADGFLPFYGDDFDANVSMVRRRSELEGDLARGFYYIET